MPHPPYIISNWVKDEHFYGREELCRALLESPERCIYLIGTRRIGKTSLLMRLATLLYPHGLYCDLMRAAGSEQLDEARLIILMQRQLRQQAPASERLRESQPIWDAPASSLCAWLEELSWRWEEQGLRITLLWDEAEMLRRLPNATLMPLRAILQHSNSLRIVICASKGLADLNERWRDAYVSPFLFGFKPEYIAGLSQSEADALITQRGTVSASPHTIANIREWAGSHPFLIQSLCSRLYTAGQLREPGVVDVVVDAQLADLFRIDIGALSPSEQQILTLLAAGRSLSASHIQEELQVPDSILHGFLEGLHALGLIRPRDTRWQISNHFLAHWLQSQPVIVNPLVTDRASMEVIDQQYMRRASTTSATMLLSDREREVLRLVAAGRSNPEIAQLLIISLDTVKSHLKHISTKLGAARRAEAVAKAKELGII